MSSVDDFNGVTRVYVDRSSRKEHHWSGLVAVSSRWNIPAYLSGCNGAGDQIHFNVEVVQ